MMSKSILSIVFLALGLFLACPGYASASDIKWQIEWLDNGSLQEKVVISGVNVAPAEGAWEQSREGNKLILERKINNWSSYQEIDDRLPLQVIQKNHLIYSQTNIGLGAENSAGLFDQIDGPDGLELSIKVPGFIISTSADQKDVSLAIWSFLDRSAFLAESDLMQVITVDGLLLSIVIVVVGLILIGIMFSRKLKKVDRIIAEEYALNREKPGDNKDGE